MVNRINDSSRLDYFFFAMSDATRRRVLRRLSSERSKTPRDLAKELDVSLPLLVKHMKVLKKANLIYCEKQGKSSQCFRVDESIKDALREIHLFLFKSESGAEVPLRNELQDNDVAGLWSGYRLSRSPLIRERLLEGFLHLVTYAAVRFSVSSKADPGKLMWIGKRVLEKEIDAHEELPAEKKETFLLEKIQAAFAKYFRSRRMKFKAPDHFLEKGETNVALSRFRRINDSFSKSLKSVSPQKTLSFILSSLPKRERQILALRYMENLTLKEIGVILGVSDARVFQIHARAIKSIEQHFKGEAEKNLP